MQLFLKTLLRTSLRLKFVLAALSHDIHDLPLNYLCNNVSVSYINSKPL